MMIKLFFITFFISELIIAFAIIKKIVEIDKAVIIINEAFSEIKLPIRTLFTDTRALIYEFSESLIHIKFLLAKKKQEYCLRLAKALFSYSLLFSLKGKYKKLYVGYEIAYDLIKKFKNA